MDASTVQMVFGSTLVMVPFVLIVVVALFMGSVFVYFFQNFLTLVVKYGLGLGVSSIG